MIRRRLANVLVVVVQLQCQCRCRSHFPFSMHSVCIIDPLAIVVCVRTEQISVLFECCRNDDDEQIRTKQQSTVQHRLLEAHNSERCAIV